jgi:hypothetical protein
MDQLLADLHADLDRANQVDSTAWTDDQVRDRVIELEALRAKLDALALAATSQLDARHLASADGAASTKAWMRCHPDARLPADRAARQVRLARKLLTLPHAATALAEGRISLDVVAKLASVDNPRTHDSLRRDEARLVAVAGRERFDRFCRHVERWRVVNDPDGARPRAGARRLHLHPTFDDCWSMDGWFDPVTGTTIAAELERLEKILFDHDWAMARERLGHDPEPHELDRTPAQRRADALKLMAERSRAASEGTVRPAPLVTIVAGADAFKDVIRTLDGTDLTPEEAAAVLDDAVLERITFDGADRPFAVSKQRCFRGALRRAILVRDEECAHPMCDERPSRCQVDHVIPANAGGPTSIDNGRCYCGYHNRARHRRPPPDDPDDQPAS